MKAFHVQLIVGVTCLMVSVSSFAYDGSWHVVENLTTHDCVRVPGFRPADGWRDAGEFKTYRMAGSWIWSHRAICQSSPVFG